ncbi:MAG: DNA mismatch repair endonuclease MutL [Desulfovermiculus sp.]|nr:DNA mismatch repair endonuclease MutL [Desulfovermiculus sp.]
MQEEGNRSQLIQVLPPELQNQIAAGEVVERPSSVLKELMENSLDAQASRILADIQGGGQSLIRVEDNGLGMGPQDLIQAMTRHATSKIATFQDLLSIASFGFRGEALPSIGSVSRMRLRSIPAGHSDGAELDVEFGVLSEVKPIPFREGTSIQVRDLFANTPARLKFLKTQQTEAKRCQEVVSRFALANLDTAFSFISNQRTVLDFSAEQSLAERLQGIWPPGITDRLLQVQARDEDYSLTGYIGHPETAQARGDRMLFFVNKRPVQDKMLISALRQAFKGRLLHKEYPQAVLFLRIPSREVDVNVHPAKLEVRFRDEKRVFSLLHHGVGKALDSSTSRDGQPKPEASSRAGFVPPEPQYTFHTFEDFLPPQAAETRPETNQPSPWPSESTLEESPQSQSQDHDPDVPHLAAPARFSVQGFTYLGQIQNTYLLLISKPGDLILVDQHAAHERILYHRSSTQGQSGQKRSLALPMHRPLHPSEKERLSRIAPMLRRLGFELDNSQPGAVLIRAVPAHLDPAKAKGLLDQILGEQADSQEDLWQMMACRQAIKSGEVLSDQEALELIQLWIATPNKEYCPHGRPAMIALGVSDLERMFKRRG